MWIISLSGDESDLNELVRSLNNENMTIYKENDTYYLKCSKIDKTTSYQEVINKATEIINLINGATKLALCTRNSIKLSDVYFLRDDGGRDIYASFELSASVNVRLNYQITKADGSVEIINPADSVRDWLVLSEQNDKINKIFSLLSNDSESWVGLYKVYEVIKKDIDTKDFTSITSSNLDRFARTANSYKAVGFEARHALDYEPPKNPMNISEARSTIFLMVNEWLSNFQK